MHDRYHVRRELKKILLLMGVAILTLTASSAAAQRTTVKNLRSGVLHNRDLPAGFVVGKVKLYRHFTSVMSGRVRLRGISPAQQVAVCNLPAGVLSKGINQGLLEAIVSRRSPSRVVLCGWRYRGIRGAHTAFALALSKAGWWDQLKKHLYHQLRTSNLGSEAFGIRARASHPSPGSPSRNYLLFFRRGNAFFSVEYLGTRALTPARFVRLAMATDSRLR